jgi:hypothetical protein
VCVVQTRIFIIFLSATERIKDQTLFGHLGGRAQLPNTIFEEVHPMTIPSKFGSNCATGSRQDVFYVNFP